MQCSSPKQLFVEAVTPVSIVAHVHDSEYIIQLNCHSEEAICSSV